MRKGTAEMNWPICPNPAVSCVNRGVTRSGNHAGNRRIADRNALASPAPMSTRARMAMGYDAVSARTIWPVAMTSAPTTMVRRAPNRSMASPTGICASA